jgi:hypothetical protein
MKTLQFFLAFTALIVGENTEYRDRLPNHQSNMLSEHNIGRISGIRAINQGIFPRLSDYQESSVHLSQANLKQPHILSIHTSGLQLQGYITHNGKVIQQICGRRFQINLSPYLSRGKNGVRISARYFPKSSSVTVAFRGTGVNVNQQTSGSGILNYVLNLSVE